MIAPRPRIFQRCAWRLFTLENNQFSLRGCADACRLRTLAVTVTINRCSIDSQSTPNFEEMTCSPLP
ncbi:hypothetical protein SB751_34635, partial [Cupriavidus sp. SIMBA_020]|uniref:hypothetical protein n=1 Tax=Cupriavidus sp. SIMBA_020 TaxID=3085766 RepID=UPI00397D13CC